MVFLDHESTGQFPLCPSHRREGDCTHPRNVLQYFLQLVQTGEDTLTVRGWCQWMSIQKTGL